MGNVGGEDEARRRLVREMRDSVAGVLQAMEPVTRRTDAEHAPALLHAPRWSRAMVWHLFRRP